MSDGFDYGKKPTAKRLKDRRRARLRAEAEQRARDLSAATLATPQSAQTEEETR